MSLKQEMFQKLDSLLTEMLTLRSRGADYSRLSHAQGLVDGFMLALVESGIATKSEILAQIRKTRTSVDGPGYGPVDFDELESAAA